MEHPATTTTAPTATATAGRGGAAPAARVRVLRHHGLVCSARLSEDARAVATGSDRAVAVHAVSTGECLQRLYMLNEAETFARGVAFTPRATHAVAGAEDASIKVWHLASQRLRHVFYGHSADVVSVDVCGGGGAGAKGAVVASGSSDGTARLWDLESGRCTDCLRPCRGGDGVEVLSVSLGRAGCRLVALGLSSGAVQVHDQRSAAAAVVAELPAAHADQVFGASLSDDGALLATAALDAHLRVWDLRRLPMPGGGGGVGVAAQQHGGPVGDLQLPGMGFCCSFNSDSYLVACGSVRGAVSLYNTRAGTDSTLHQSGVDGAVVSLSVRRDMLVACNSSKDVAVYSLAHR